MNIDNPNGPIGLDDSEEEGSGCGPGGAGGKGLVNVELQEQLTRRVKHGQHLEQQVERLLQVAATARQEEQSRRQEILRELYAEKTRRQEAEAESCVQRHRSAELTFLVSGLEAELQAVTGLPRPKQPPVAPFNLKSEDDSEEEQKEDTDETSQLRTEVNLLRQQVVIHRDDFDREHQEKEKLLRLNQQLQTELDRTGRELTTTKSRLNKLESEKDVLISDNRLFKDKLQGVSRDWSREEALKDTALLEEKIFNKMSGNHIFDRNFTKSRPHSISEEPCKPLNPFSQSTPTSMAPRTALHESKMPPWPCPLCTLENQGANEFCEACGHRRRDTRPLYRQQSAPVSGWTECDAYSHLAYR